MGMVTISPLTSLAVMMRPGAPSSGGKGDCPFCLISLKLKAARMFILAFSLKLVAESQSFKFKYILEEFLVTNLAIRLRC